MKSGISTSPVRTGAFAVYARTIFIASKRLSFGIPASVRTGSIFFPSAVRFEALEGAPEMAAAVEGPVVLAALTDQDCGFTVDPDHPESSLLPEIPHTYDVFPWQQNTWRTRRQPANFRLIPLYEVTDEVYTVYLTLHHPNEGA